MTPCSSLTPTLVIVVQLMGALDDGDSSVCSTVDYQPPEPEPEEVEEEEEEPLEPESCFTEGETGSWTSLTSPNPNPPPEVTARVFSPLRLREAMAVSDRGRAADRWKEVVEPSQDLLHHR